MADEKKIDDFIEHFGVKGMKWGVRRNKSKSGVSRLRGAVLDRNQRATQKQIRRSKGKGTLSDRAAQATLKMSVGEKRAKEYRDFRLSYLKDQRKRISEGETSVLDKLQTYSTINVTDLLVSRTSGNSGRLADRFG